MTAKKSPVSLGSLLKYPGAGPEVTEYGGDTERAKFPSAFVQEVTP
jgi:hypothetical protein